MLKTLLLSGWFRVQPFAKYVVVVMLIAPLVAASSHATSVKQSEVMANTSVATESSSVSMENALVGEPGAVRELPELNSLANGSKSMPAQVAIVIEPKLSQSEGNYSSVVGTEDGQPGNGHDPFATVELAPSTGKSSRLSETAGQQSLIEKIKAARNQVVASRNDQLLYAAKIEPKLGNPSSEELQATVEQADAQMQQASEDPLNSPYPIPMKWINATQEQVGANGGGVRYYRSVPVISPDGRYAVYSRVQLEVKPEQHNSRVSSVLFIEDRKTKKLRVAASTSRNKDALVRVSIPQDANGDGTIGVLVPVSWSEGGDRFLARRFEGVMNTSDVSDYAVIWHRDRDRTNTVEPARAEDDHERIAILLGWSKTQPNHVMFRTGELGDENWPLVTVSDDGKTVGAADIDQPVTFGNRVSEVWAGPQVAYR